jgi:hypothetical protein
MTSIFDMTRRVTRHDLEDHNLKSFIDENDASEERKEMIRKLSSQKKAVRNVCFACFIQLH